MTQPYELPSDPSDLEVWHAWADEQLAPMDLSVGLLHQVAEAGQRKKDAASPLSPPSIPGTDGWSGAVVALRERTGWRKDDKDQLPRTVHPDGHFYVVVRTGTGGVGQVGTGTQPTTKNRLKKILRRIINRVPTTIPLIDTLGNPVDSDEHTEPQMWLFLISFHSGMIHSELSRPIAQKGGHVTAYGPRIPLPPLPFNPISTDILDSETDDEPDENPNPNIDVQPI